MQMPAVAIIENNGKDYDTKVKVIHFMMLKEKTTQ